jgi:signal transduction histidine kinase
MDLGHEPPALKPVDVNDWITQLADDRAVVFSERQWVTFSVGDSGPRISFEDVLHIFERFYRGGAGHDSRAPGTGLGLAICDEIVPGLNGKIVVDSQPGQGSTFTVWLPAAGQSVAQAALQTKTLGLPGTN